MQWHLKLPISKTLSLSTDDFRKLCNLPSLGIAAERGREGSGWEWNSKRGMGWGSGVRGSPSLFPPVSVSSSFFFPLTLRPYTRESVHRLSIHPNYYLRISDVLLNCDANWRKPISIVRDCVMGGGERMWHHQFSQMSFLIDSSHLASIATSVHDWKFYHGAPSFIKLN